MRSWTQLPGALEAVDVLSILNIRRCIAYIGCIDMNILCEKFAYIIS